MMDKNDSYDSSLEIVEEIPSLCPQCNKEIKSLIIERNGKIYQRPQCSEHKFPEFLIFSSSMLYHRLRNWNERIFPIENQMLVPQAELENGKRFSTSANLPVLAVIDITNRCNYKCPLCFAGNDNHESAYFLDLEVIRKMLDSLLMLSPLPCRHVQFSGGEPTLHPKFPQILRMAKEMGFNHIQVATNGRKFADKDFTFLCEEMGLHTLYLQFDGMSDDVYLLLRGQRLMEEKMKAVKNITHTDMRLVLVPTIVASINVDQIRPIFEFALEHSKHVTGISIQPAANTGRVEITRKDNHQFNLADMAIEFGNQTGLTRFPDDWFPLNAISKITQGVSKIRGDLLPNPACDAFCSLGTYFYIDDKNKPFCVNQFLDMERFFGTFEMLAHSGGHTFFGQAISRLVEAHALSKCFKKRCAPEGMTSQRLLRGLEGWEDKQIGRSPDWYKQGFNGMFVAGMHFMDSFNYNIRRLRRCIIQYVTAEGKLIPFCSYNAGYRYRIVEEMAHKNQYQSQFKNSGANNFHDSDFTYK